jgi:hypothetical protein
MGNKKIKKMLIRMSTVLATICFALLDAYRSLIVAGMVTKWTWDGGYCLGVWSCFVLCCLDLGVVCCCGRFDSSWVRVFIDIPIANDAEALL